MTPESMWELCAKGDAAAWEILVRTHERRVFNSCYRFTKSDTEAQDLTQEVFLRVFRNAKAFRPDGGGSLQIWMGRMTRNLLIDNYRRKRHDRITGKLLKDPPASDSRPDRLLAVRELRGHLDAALRKLPPGLRQVVVLREIEDLEYRQIAHTLGIPEGTVKSRLNRARTELARLIQKKSLTD
jgi:RNA polymerase sigma-70 factor (ECF subfamily)